MRLLGYLQARNSGNNGRTILGLVSCNVKFSHRFSLAQHTKLCENVIFKLSWNQFLVQYLLLECVPLILCVIEVQRGEGKTNFSQKLVPPESVPVPHTQPESTRVQLNLRQLVLGGEEDVEWNEFHMEWNEFHVEWNEYHAEWKHYSWIYGRGSTYAHLRGGQELCFTTSTPRIHTSLSVKHLFS